MMLDQRARLSGWRKAIWICRQDAACNQACFRAASRDWGWSVFKSAAPPDFIRGIVQRETGKLDVESVRMRLDLESKDLMR